MKSFLHCRGSIPSIKKCSSAACGSHHRSTHFTYHYHVLSQTATHITPCNTWTTRPPLHKQAENHPVPPPCTDHNPTELHGLGYMDYNDIPPSNPQKLMGGLECAISPRNLTKLKHRPNQNKHENMRYLQASHALVPEQHTCTRARTAETGCLQLVFVF